MAGFPSVHLDRYINILVEDDWTVIVVDQIEDIKGLNSSKPLSSNSREARVPPSNALLEPAISVIEEDEDDEPEEENAEDDDSDVIEEAPKGKKKAVSKKAATSKSKKKVARAITRIASPSTFIEKTLKSDNNFLVSIFLREDQYSCNKAHKLNQVGSNGLSLISAGCSTIDLTTGENFSYEVYSNGQDQGLGIDETFRFICTFRPREIIINSDNFNAYDEDALISKLELHSIPHQIKLNKVPKEYMKISYQNELLKKCFPDHGLLSPLEYLDLESKSVAAMSYVLMLQYAYEHNERLINGLPKPQILGNYHDKMKSRI